MAMKSCRHYRDTGQHDLSCDGYEDRAAHPALLAEQLPIYATSQIFSGNENTLVNYDLNGIRFVDMPWLLQPDHPAVMSYARANPPLSIDRERLYALGIDAFRLAQLLLSRKIALPLDGVTGDSICATKCSSAWRRPPSSRRGARSLWERIAALRSRCSPRR